MSLTEKDEEFSDELRENCEVMGDGYKESKRRGGREVEEGWRGRGISVSEVISTPYTNSVCVLECKCPVNRAKGVFLHPPCVCPPLTTTGDPPSCPLHAGPS